MYCTPSHLFADQTLWLNPTFFYFITQSYQNHTPGDPFDCALKSIECESNATKSVVYSSDYNDIVFWFDLFVFWIGLTIFSVSGFLGNIFNVIIFAKNKIANESTNNILLALSITELLHSVFFLVLICICSLCFFDVSQALSLFNRYSPVCYFQTKWLLLLGLDLVTLLAIQRATAVLLPFRASTIFSNRNTKILIFLLALLWFLTYAPLYYFGYARTLFHPSFNKYISLGWEQRFDYESTMAYQIHYSSNRSIIDLCVLIIAVSLTIIKLKSQGKSRSDLQATERVDNNDNQKSKPQMSTREMKAMKMSLAVCITTFTVYTIVVVGMEVVLPTVGDVFKSPVGGFANFGTQLFSVANCSLNFFLYLIMSSQYKDAFLKLFKKDI